MSKIVHFFDEKYKVIVCDPRLREGETKTTDKQMVSCDVCRKTMIDKRYYQVIKNRIEKLRI